MIKSPCMHAYLKPIQNVEKSHDLSVSLDFWLLHQRDMFDTSEPNIDLKVFCVTMC